MAKIVIDLGSIRTVKSSLGLSSVTLELRGFAEEVKRKPYMNRNQRRSDDLFDVSKLG